MSAKGKLPPGTSPSISALQTPGAQLPSYPDLGEAAFGPWGRRAVVAFVCLEFFGALCMCLIIVWSNVITALGLTPDPRTLLVVGGVATAATAPTCLIRSYKDFSCISVVGFVSSACVVLSVIGIFFFELANGEMHLSLIHI